MEKCETVAKYDSSEDFDIRDTKEFWEEVRKGLVCSCTFMFVCSCWPYVLFVCFFAWNKVLPFGDVVLFLDSAYFFHFDVSRLIEMVQ